MPKQSTKTDVQIALLREISTKLDRIMVALEKGAETEEKRPSGAPETAKRDAESSFSKEYYEKHLPERSLGTRPQYVDYVLYTDGSCVKNPGGEGGWAFILLDNHKNGKTIEGSGRAESTTNQKMEIKAAINGLKEVPKGKSVEVVSDSQYLLKTMLGKFRMRANLDLWEELNSAMDGKTVYTKWVRGHSGDPMNERCDQLARG